MRFFIAASCAFTMFAVVGCADKPATDTATTPAPVASQTIATNPQTKSLPGMPPPNPAVQHIPGSVIGADGSPPGAGTDKPKP